MNNFLERIGANLCTSWQVAGWRAPFLLQRVLINSRDIKRASSRVLLGSRLAEIENTLQTKSERPKLLKPYDIVVPIWNAAEQLKSLIDCLEAVDQSKIGKIVMVNDASTDESIHAILQAYSATIDKIEVIQLDEQAGFAKAVNAGLEATTGDVVILNTDVVFEPLTLESLIAGLHANPDSASVSALTNNGYLVSIPDRLQPCPQLWNRGSNQLDCTARELFSGRYLPISIGPASCIAYKREFLEAVGNFPTGSFGYGEDTLLGVQATQRNYKNYVALDSYAAHQGGASYTDSKIPLSLQASHFVLNTCPEFTRLVVEDLATSDLPYYQTLLMLKEPLLTPHVSSDFEGVSNLSWLDDEDRIASSWRIDSSFKDFVHERISG